PPPSASQTAPSRGINPPPLVLLQRLPLIPVKKVRYDAIAGLDCLGPSRQQECGGGERHAEPGIDAVSGHSSWSLFPGGKGAARSICPPLSANARYGDQARLPTSATSSSPRKSPLEKRPR